ncbi:hypothetical protein PJP08_29455, partial [Mycobacterium kansasii]
MLFTQGWWYNHLFVLDAYFYIRYAIFGADFGPEYVARQYGCIFIMNISILNTYLDTSFVLSVSNTSVPALLMLPFVSGE